MKIWLVQLEELDERYTAQWADWFPMEMKRRFINHEVVRGEKLTSKIESGDVLDSHGTNYYKATQLANICKLFREKKVNDGDVFLLYDGWFPGVEMIKYMANMDKIKVKVYAIFHAGTYDRTDFTCRYGMQNWAKGLESHWFTEFYDGIFVATEYHKKVILENRLCAEDKIHVTGLPMYVDTFPDFKDVKKENTIVFPHRLDEEKQPELFEQTMKKIQDDHPNWDYIMTKKLKLPKREYYQILAKSKIVVSTALHEFWGIGILEACHYGCIPVLPNKLSYKEIYPSYVKYDNYDQMEELIKLWIQRWENDDEDLKLKINCLQNIPKSYSYAIGVMVGIIQDEVEV